MPLEDRVIVRAVPILFLLLSVCCSDALAQEFGPQPELSSQAEPPQKAHPATPETTPEHLDTAVPSTSAPRNTARPTRSLSIPRPAHEQLPLGSESSSTTEPPTSGWPRVLIALVGTIALAIGVAAGVRKLAGGRFGLSNSARAPSGLVEVLARYPLSPRHHLIVLKLDRRVLLLSESTGLRGTAAGLRTITEITDPEEVASILLKTRDDEGDSIAAKFRDAMDRHESLHESFAEPVEPRQGLGRLSELA